MRVCGGVLLSALTALPAVAGPQHILIIINVSPKGLKQTGTALSGHPASIRGPAF